MLLINQNAAVSRDRGGSTGWVVVGPPGRLQVYLADRSTGFGIPTTSLASGSTLTSSTTSLRCRARIAGRGAHEPRIQRAVLGEALQNAIGDAEVPALLFSTHDLDPSSSNRRCCRPSSATTCSTTSVPERCSSTTRSSARVDIDVYYEGRALAAQKEPRASNGTGSG